MEICRDDSDILFSVGVTNIYICMYLRCLQAWEPVLEPSHYSWSVLAKGASEIAINFPQGSKGILLPPAKSRVARGEW